jgi:hypothetical protein
VDAHPGRGAAPGLSTDSAVGQVNELFAGEEVLLDVLDNAFDPGLSVGVATRAASMTKPLDCAYSKKTSLNRGAVFSAVMTMDFMLSGMTTGNTAAK